MNNNIKFSLDSTTIENINIFSEILKKDPSTILNEALDDYFTKIQKQLLEKNISDENAMTNLDFDEFWDDVDI